MNRLVYSRQQADVNIWRTPGRMGRGPSARFITSTRIDADPDFSADGKKVAFGSDRSGNDEIWISGSDGSNPMQLTSFGGAANGSPRWSPDAKHIAFDANVTGQWQIHLVDVNGGRPRRITNSPAPDMIPTWSRNGKWIYFASHRSRDLQVWKVSIDSGVLVQVTKHGGFMALESADGNYVYYTKNRGEVSSLWRVPAGGGEEIQVLAPVDGRGFAVVRHGIYFRRHGTHGRTDIYFLNTATKSITPVATLDGSFFNGFSVSQDEQWILYGQSEQRAGDLVLVENFR
jgi:Tol biopolymer transport system component